MLSPCANLSLPSSPPLLQHTTTLPYCSMHHAPCNRAPFPIHTVPAQEEHNEPQHLNPWPLSSYPAVRRVVNARITRFQSPPYRDLLERRLEQLCVATGVEDAEVHGEAYTEDPLLRPNDLLHGDLFLQRGKAISQTRRWARVGVIRVWLVAVDRTMGGVPAGGSEWWWDSARTGCSYRANQIPQHPHWCNQAGAEKPNRAVVGLERCPAVAGVEVQPADVRCSCNWI